jgi:GT2 family glycosyltransferase
MNDFSKEKCVLKICIVIPSHNRADLLKKLLSQIMCQTSIHKSEIYDIIVVVDGSTDGTLEMLAKEFPDAHIIKGDGTLWYTRSMNEGFKYALQNLEPDFFLTLNDDVELADNYIDEILKIARKNDGKSIVGSLGITKSKPHRVVTPGNSFKNKHLGLYRQHLPFLSEVDPNELTGMHPSITLPGRGMLIPVSILKELRGFDEKFKQYHSDGDFTLRTIKRGYIVKINWATKIYVNLEKTSNTTSFLNKSFLLLLKSYFKPTSRNYLLDKLRFNWRHSSKLLSPFLMGLFVIVSVRNLILKSKV